MKYPVVQANSNGRALTSVFYGINRLPEGKEGEGQEFMNLTLDLYPAVATTGLGETGEVLYIKDSEGADTIVDTSKLQAIGDVYEKDGKIYLTGVYDGNFYYRGTVSEYYFVGDGEKLSKTDKVSIEKIGKTYVIFAVKESGKSTVLSYNTEAVATTQHEERKKQNVLTTEVIKYKIPTESFSDLYIYKMVVEKQGATTYRTRLYRIQQNTGKQYYMMYMYRHYQYNSNSSRYYPQNVVEAEIYEQYSGMYGAGMMLKSSLDDFNSEYYCFDDGDKEHPVKFVIDAASNSGDVIERLLEREKTVYHEEGWTWYENVSENEAGAYYIDTSSDAVKPSQKTRNLRDLDAETGESSDAEKQPWERGCGIIGHFEKWNKETERYEFYNTEDFGAVWRRVGADGNELKYYNTGYSSYEPVMDESHNESNTLIPINPTGIETDGIRLSDMTAYKGRIFATVNDGSMIIASELGSYTDFGEFQGVSTDSGYFNSLTSGKYTGISEYQGTLVVFKENRMSIYYGDTPSDMVLSHEIKNVGCIDSGSIKEVNGVLIFLGKDGFYAYSGGQPQHISRKLNKVYKSALAFVSGRKYYAATDDELLIYDTDTGAWTSSDPIDIRGISGERIFLSDGRVMKVSNNEEWSGEWVYESMDMFEDMIDDKGINEIYIRAKLNGRITVKTVTDEEEREHLTFYDSGEKIKVYRVPVKFLHGNYYRIRLEGSGKCILYAIERKCYAGGRQR